MPSRFEMVNVGVTNGAKDELERRAGAPCVSTPPPRRVIVDSLNFLERLIPFAEYDFREATPWQMYAEAMKRVQELLQAARASNMRLYFVLDAGWSCTEAGAAWRRRREREVFIGKRVPYNCDTSLTAILITAGADVLRPQGVDADDVVATLAATMPADVLSRDSDFLRYRELPRARLFQKYYMKRGRLFVTRDKSYRLSAEKQKLPPRALLPQPLDVDSWRASAPVSKLVVSRKRYEEDPEFVYLRGNADSFTMRLGNLHAVAAPLRQRVYASLAIPRVHEIYPVWDATHEQVAWVDALVDCAVCEKTHALDAVSILEALRAADGFLDDKSERWRDYTRMAMAGELSAVAADQSGSVVDELRAAVGLAADEGDEEAKRLMQALATV